MNRRYFFKKTVLAGAGAILIPEILQAAMPETSEVSGSQANKLKKGDVILFQGDSITDAGRKRDEESVPNKQSMLGSGYAMFITARILADHPEKELQIYNRGISGNKVYQLQERWSKDCFDLKPNILSILIGVNDYWHMKNGNYDGDLAKYMADYTDLIVSTQKDMPGVQIVICEPFILAGGSALDETWEAEFAGYRKAAKEISLNYKTKFVPFQSVFNEALKKAPAQYWGGDGVHPSMAGAQLMAEAWMKAVL